MSVAEDCCCGPLRRCANGTWWYEGMFLGDDGVPLFASDALGNRMSLVCLRLAFALGDAVHRLRDAGCVVTELENTIIRYEEWRRTGTWPRLGLELKPAMHSFELRRLVGSAISLLSQVLPFLSGHEALSLLTKCEGWVERAVDLVPESFDDDRR